MENPSNHKSIARTSYHTQYAPSVWNKEASDVCLNTNDVLMCEHESDHLDTHKGLALQGVKTEAWDCQKSCRFSDTDAASELHEVSTYNRLQFMLGPVSPLHWLTLPVATSHNTNIVMNQTYVDHEVYKGEAP